MKISKDRYGVILNRDRSSNEYFIDLGRVLFIYLFMN